MKRLLINHRNQHDVLTMLRAKLQARQEAAAGDDGVAVAHQTSNDENGNGDDFKSNMMTVDQGSVRSQSATAGVRSPSEDPAANAADFEVLHLHKLNLPSTLDDEDDGPSSSTTSKKTKSSLRDAPSITAVIMQLLRQQPSHRIDGRHKKQQEGGRPQPRQRIIIESCTGEGVLQILGVIFSPLNQSVHALVWKDQDLRRHNHHRLQRQQYDRQSSAQPNSHAACQLRSIEMEEIRFGGEEDASATTLDQLCHEWIFPAFPGMQSINFTKCTLPHLNILGKMLRVQSSKGLKSLTIMHCGVSDRQLAALLRVVLNAEEETTMLEYLNLDSNHACGVSSMECLKSHLLSSSCHLVQLSLNGGLEVDRSTPRGKSHLEYCTQKNDHPDGQQAQLMKLLAAGLSGNTSLRRLNLANNGLSSRSFHYLLANGLAKQHNTTLQRLDFHGNAVADDGLFMITEKRSALLPSVFQDLSLRHMTLYNHPHMTPECIESTLLRAMSTFAQLSLFRVEIPRIVTKKRNAVAAVEEAEHLSNIQFMLNHFGDLNRGGRELICEEYNNATARNLAIFLPLVLENATVIQQQKEESLSLWNFDRRATPQPKSFAANVVYELLQSHVLLQH